MLTTQELSGVCIGQVCGSLQAGIGITQIVFRESVRVGVCVFISRGVVGECLLIFRLGYRVCCGVVLLGNRVVVLSCAVLPVQTTSALACVVTSTT